MSEKRATGKRRTGEIVFLIVYILAFFMAHTTYTYFYSHTILGSMFLLQGIIRFSIWTVPIFIYLFLIKKNPFEYLRLNKNILRGIIWGAIVGSAIILFNIISIYLLRRTVNFTYSIRGAYWLQNVINIIIMLFQPFYVILIFSEEVLFRGFLLRKVEDISSFWIGNSVNAFLFATVHYIGWSIQGKSITGVVGVFIFAIITGIVVKKTNSLWSGVLMHICNNFIASVII